MNIANEICASMRASSECRDLGNGDVAVNTHCLYPSNAVVQVIVQSVASGYLVSDDGGAIRQAVTAGVELSKAAQAKYMAVAHKQGLYFLGGIVSAPSVPIEALPIAVVLVANASKEIADQIFLHHRIKRARDFRALVRELLRSEFLQTPKEEFIVGHTNKQHRFDNVISLPTGKRALVDAVLHDANSINSRVVANLDVRTGPSADALTQSIIYDDEEDWGASDLSILQITEVPVVPFSRAGAALHQLLRA